MTEPLRLALDVSCPVEHAFAVWTARIDSWWPADHTVSGRSNAVIVLEPRSGGRIFERTLDGVEHDWGEITRWEPPRRLGYRWHLMRDPAEATQVEISFVAAGTSTRIEIEHTGWDRLGTDGPVWRERNHAGWSTLLPHFVRATGREHDKWQRAADGTERI
jgi:uncharacterized protein YndB with AHSA1/START domain